MKAHQKTIIKKGVALIGMIWAVFYIILLSSEIYDTFYHPHRLRMVPYTWFTKNFTNLRIWDSIGIAVHLTASILFIRSLNKIRNAETIIGWIIMAFYIGYWILAILTSPIDC